MPPRKRAEPKPPTPDAPAAEQQGDETLPTETVPPADADAGATTPAPVDPPAEASPPDDKPTKSDLQEVEQPCPICFPNGWADGAFSHGCEHGTWIRDT
jgi:hypothetical protein